VLLINSTLDYCKTGYINYLCAYDLYSPVYNVPTIDLSILLNVEIRTEAAQFPEKEF
jgi:hypothetical protein